jgi:transposase
MEVAQLGVHAETLRQWRRKARAAGGEGSADATVPSLEEENRRLRRENARLLEEREILTIATAFFAKDAR